MSKEQEQVFWNGFERRANRIIVRYGYKYKERSQYYLKLLFNRVLADILIASEIEEHANKTQRIVTIKL